MAQERHQASEGLGGGYRLGRNSRRWIRGETPIHLGYPTRKSDGSCRSAAEEAYRRRLKHELVSLVAGADSLYAEYRHGDEWPNKFPFRDVENVLLYNLCAHSLALPPRTLLRRVEDRSLGSRQIAFYQVGIVDEITGNPSPAISAKVTLSTAHFRAPLPLWLEFKRDIQGQQRSSLVIGDFDVVLSVRAPTNFKLTVERFKKLLDSFIAALHFRKSCPPELETRLSKEAVNLVISQNGACLGEWMVPQARGLTGLTWSPADHRLRACFASLAHHEQRDVEVVAHLYDS